MELQRVWQIFDTLPLNAKQEVIDFIEFLQKRYEKSEKSQGSKKAKITEEDFVGMWKNYDALIDSSSWVRDLRKGEWNS